MTAELPPPPPVLRDFLYVDIARVRSLLAQMSEGVPEQLVAAMTRARDRRGGLNLPPVSFELKGGSEDRREETRSMSDMLFVLFEEAAESLGWLQDISDTAADPISWSSGELPSSLPPSAMIRVTGPTRLVDATHFSATLERFSSIMQMVMSLQPQQGASGRTTGGQRGQARSGRPQERQLPGGVTPSQVEKIGKLYQSLMPAGISAKVMPCGTDYPSYALSGVLLDRAEYLEPERAAIFSRFGVVPSEWTVVGTITRSEKAGIPDISNAPSITNADGTLDRNAFERFAELTLSYLEQVGMTEAPRAPEIGITPLAIYRVVPHNPSDDAL
jgi:hypothetical protein